MMEKRGIVHENVTPAEDAKCGKEGPLEAYQTKYGKATGRQIFEADRFIVEKLDENHPTRRMVKAMEEQLAKRPR